MPKTENMPAENKELTGIAPKDTVLLFIEALNDEYFNAARNYLDDNVSFVGVMGTRDGADVYIKDMEQMKFKYDIEKVFATGNDVCVWYNINMGKATILCSGWYQLKRGRIASIKVVFDPRPLLEAQQ